MTPPDSDIPWTFTLAWAFLITSLVRLFPARGQKAAMGIFGALFQVLYLTNALLFRARGTFFSFSALIFAADGFRFLDPSYLRVRKLVWVGLLCGILHGSGCLAGPAGEAQPEGPGGGAAGDRPVRRRH